MRRGRRRECIVEPVIDLVRDEADALGDRGIVQLGERLAVIMVPVGLAGLATSTPLSGARRWAASSICGVIACRVAAVVSITTGSQPSALRIWR